MHGVIVKGQLHRSQWVVIHSESNTDGQFDHMQYKAHLQDTNNGTVVPQRADCERKWTFGGHIHRHKLN